jgi:Protein of unknown function (DUF2568)
MHALNLGLRFLLELAGIVALAYWGWAAAEPPLRYLLALVAPAVLIVVWALVVAPKANNSIPQPTRMVIGSVLLLLAAGALALAGQPLVAAGFAILIVANTALLLVRGTPGGS